MVHLNRITTKTGDDGSTSLGDGTRVSKTDPRIVALGSVDELNAAIGLAMALADVPDGPEELARSLRQIQNDLFDAGAELCFPAAPSSEGEPSERLGITQQYVSRIEQQVDAITERLPPLNSFVLPGGTLLAAHLHVARVICRRAERDVLALAELETVGTELKRYLNRLSDFLFVLSRSANDDGRGDVLWKPGESRSTPE